MALVRITKPDMTVEEACWHYLIEEIGKERAAGLAASGYVESTLAVNPGLAELMTQNRDSLPVNTVITLPEVPEETIIESVHLWDAPDET